MRDLERKRIREVESWRAAGASELEVRELELVLGNFLKGRTDCRQTVFSYDEVENIRFIPCLLLDH